ncbi:MAG: site-specific DNA-methyltransferase [Deltaproteobacteria bacterium]|nr:site-specific DNA-methyltransferase [Deltaproteobacteria bacterium]
MTSRAQIIIGDSRAMPELADGSVDLVVTSPPYWHIKDYGVPGQVGYGQTLHEYLKDLYRVWRECFRALREGSRLCVNIGDQFARSVVYGRYKIIPLHAEIIGQCEEMGFDFLGAIIWQKKTTMNTTGGANVMGSYPFPPNGLVEIDYEFILIFKKPGKGKIVSREVKEASRLTKEEWKEYFSGHWRFGGAKQVGHEAMFPEELPRRLIRMFTFVGDTVLDPFLGSGTTVKAALDLGRNAVGYEIHEGFRPLILEKLGMQGKPWAYDEIITQSITIITPLTPSPSRGEGWGGGECKFSSAPSNTITERPETPPLPALPYRPRLPDARPLGEMPASGPALNKVVAILAPDTLKLDTGQLVKFLGVRIVEKDQTLAYLTDKILGKSIIVKTPDGAAAAADPASGDAAAADPLPAYVYLKNRLFINKYLLAAGLAAPDLTVEHKHKNKFIKVWEKE